MKNIYLYISNSLKGKEVSIENILIRYSIVLSFICFIYMFIWLSISFYPGAIVNLIMVFCFFLIPYFKIGKTNVSNLINLELIFASLLILFLTALAWKLAPMLIVWYAVIPFFAILTLSKKQAFVWVIVTLGLAVLTYPLYLFINYHSTLCLNLEFNLIMNTFQILGVTVFYYFVGNQYRNLRDYNQNEIENKNKVLELIQQKLENSQKYKDAFFANISHEIRTPLNAIKGVSDLINLENNTKNIKLIDVLKSSTSNLILLVNNILEVSELGEGQIELNKNIINIEKICIDAFNIFNSEAQKKDIEFKLSFINELPVNIIGDAQRITQILVNIIGNAIKFTEKGSVTFNIKSLNNHNSNTETAIIQFTITDTGIGMHKDKIEKVFNSFYQLDKTNSVIQNGAGLGIYVTHKLVTIHNGKINCNSKFGNGTTIDIEIPFDKSNVEIEDEIKILNSENLNVIDWNNFNILIVDDNHTNILVEKMLFLKANNNIKISTAENGLVAIEKTNETKFDLILMDIQMPILDGLEATKEILNNKLNKNRKTPIFGVTADISSEMQNKCINIGMKTVITKPIEMSEMLKKINIFCNPQ